MTTIRLLTCMALPIVGALLIFNPVSLAQEEVETPPPVAPAPAPEKPVEAADPATFPSREAIVDHFEKLRGELATKREEIETIRQLKREELQDFLRREQRLSERQLASTRSYIAANAEAKDLGPARFDVLLFTSQLGQWEQAIAACDEFLKQHSGDGDDVVRIASYVRALSIHRLPGREAEAVRELDRFLAKYNDSVESDHARTNLLLAYLLNDQVNEARVLCIRTLGLDHVKEDDAAKEWLRSKIADLNKVGTAMPDGLVKDASGNAQPLSNLLGTRPTLVWYGDTQDGNSVAAAKALEDLAIKHSGKLNVLQVSVNKREDVWRQAAERSSSTMTRVFEGRSESKDLTATKLGVDAIPFIVLVNTDKTIHRFDVGLAEAERMVEMWLKREAKKVEESKPVTEPEKG